MTWYLYEDMPRAGEPPKETGLHKGWRGPLHAQVIQGGNEPTGVYRLRQESVKDIIDGTSKTMLAGDLRTSSRGDARFGHTHGATIYCPKRSPNHGLFPGDYFACRDLGEVGSPNSPITGRSFRTCMSAWFSGHPAGMNAEYCDGSGRWVSFDVDRNVFAAMGSIAGQEVPINTP